jgi:hypothetical protein
VTSPLGVTPRVGSAAQEMTTTWVDVRMATTLAEAWSPETQGFSRRTASAGKNATETTSLCLGAGLPYDKAEEARVAAEEARVAAEEAHRERATGASAASRRSPYRNAKGRQGSPAQRRAEARATDRHTIPIGWLSFEARTLTKDTTAAPTYPTGSAVPLQGPLDPRVLGRTFRSLEVVDDPSDDASKVRKGHSGKSTSGWTWDADYEDKNLVDPRPILHTRINSGITSPTVWDPKSYGYVGTDRMRVQDDKKRSGSSAR